MCGITGTIFSQRVDYSTRVEPAALLSTLTKFELSLELTDFNRFFALVIKYKSDCNFLHYFDSEAERENIGKIHEKLNRLGKELEKGSKSVLGLSTRENKWDALSRILDAGWFLGEELTQRLSFVRQFYKYDDLAQSHSILFFKTFNTIINSINLLEIRGRDSLGLLLQFSLKRTKDNLIWFERARKEGNYHAKLLDETIVISCVYKIFNRIGTIGENSRKVLEKIKIDRLAIDLIKAGCYQRIVIVAHTRWASVGEVSAENTHPLINLTKASTKVPSIFSLMNGEIYNYKNIFSEAIREENVQYNSNEESDTMALSLLFSRKHGLSVLDGIRENISRLDGSFTAAIVSNEEPGIVLLIRKGNQGLYFGKSYDRILFASDVYGLVEESQRIFHLEDNSFCILGRQSANTDLEIYEHGDKKLKPTKKGVVYVSTPITTRDVSKKRFKHYFLKEIYESESIVSKTLSRFLEPEGLKTGVSELFRGDLLAIAPNLLDKIRCGGLDQILIVGMGTCHTAAMAIAAYMRKQWERYLPDVEIRAILASEASAFHLEENMDRVLVIGIAQSGTTMDTNVFVKMAKKRGAYCLAILNKREGDISFLVDTTLYLGDGRDIEIAVPSSKTYVSHIVAGQLLTLYISLNVFKNNQNVIAELKRLAKIPQVIITSLKMFREEDLGEALEKFLITPNWYVTHDQFTEDIGAETRIKFSECCYKSVPMISCGEVREASIENSLFVYVAGDSKSVVERNIRDMVDLNNYVIAIVDKRVANNIDVNSDYVTIIPGPSVSRDLRVIPAIISSQLLTYYVALHMDKRKEYFQELIGNLEKGTNVDQELKDLAENSKGHFISTGYPLCKINALYQIVEEYRTTGRKEKLEQIIGELEELRRFSRRPIDTIKHQAKTITVGTQRRENLEDQQYSSAIEHLSSREGFNKADIPFINTPRFDRISNRKVYLCTEGIRQPIVDFMVNFLNSASRRLPDRPNYVGNNSCFLGKHPDKNSLVISVSSGLKRNTRKISSHVHFSLEDKTRQLILAKIVQGYVNHSNRNLVLELSRAVDLCITILSIGLPKTKQETLICYANTLATQVRASYEFLQGNEHNERISEIGELIGNSQNVKFLGSGENFHAARFMALLLGKKMRKAIAFDSLENHKHIDMSGEPLLITLISNICDPSYREDAYSELEKAQSHSNIPIVVTNLGDERANHGFTNVLRLPYAYPEISLLIYLKCFENLYCTSRH